MLLLHITALIATCFGPGNEKEMRKYELFVMTTAHPFALRLLLPSCHPEQMRIVEKTRGSGIGFVIPFSLL